MVRAPLVDKQCDFEGLLDALPPLLQTLFDHLDFPFERFRRTHQFDGLVRMFGASKGDLTAELSGCID